MKFYVPVAAILLTAAVPALYAQTPALNGEPYIHDPSTIAFSDGKFFTFGTGGGGLISEDGWTWHGGAQRPGGGVAPDVIKIGDRYYMAYARGGGGMSGGHASNVYVMWTKSLDPNSPDFKFSEAELVASSDGTEDCDAIDPAFLLDPTTGRLWLSYGTYFGYIRMVELDPKTGKRVAGNQAVNVAIDMEATALLYRDGWYYLLGTHGTCCDGANSTYNIRVGRSRNVLGPYLDHIGIPLLKGGGKLVVAASGHFVGAGHFGRLDLGDGVEKFSCHYEADLDRSGRSVLAATISGAAPLRFSPNGAALRSSWRWISSACLDVPLSVASGPDAAVEAALLAVHPQAPVLLRRPPRCSRFRPNDSTMFYTAGRLAISTCASAIT
jgi:arabinan endo-1,5-alpha-L-arabinosidase